MIQEALKEFGLDDKEIIVYLSTLNLGQSPALQISQKAQLQRELTYVVLKRLEKKAVISHTINDYKKYFKAIEPKELLLKIEERKNLMKKALPELEKIKNTKESIKPTTESYIGIEGIKTTFNKILNYIENNPTEKIIYGYGSAGKLEELLKWSFPHFIEKRKKAGIKFKGIYNKTKKGIEKKNLPLSEIKFIPKKIESPTFNLIYENHVVTIIFSEEPMSIVIKSKEVYQSHKQYFNQMWKIAKK